MERRGRLRRRFTLIELLVVLAVITVLMAMLLPALKKAMNVARRTACMSRQKQLSIVVRLYADCHQEFIPLGYCEQKQSNYWVYNHGYGKEVLFSEFVRAGLMDNPLILYCPQLNNYDTEKNPWPPGQTSTLGTRSDFALRPVINWPYYSGLPSAFPKLTKYARKAIVADVVSSRANVPGRHKNGVNVLYGDGSVLWVPYTGPFAARLSEVPTGSFSSSYNDEMDAVWNAFDQAR